MVDHKAPSSGLLVALLDSKGDPPDRHLDLIPVGLKEAALDSPTFRATSLHLTDQVDGIEKWLDSYSRSTSRLVSEINHLESSVNLFIAASVPPPTISEAIVDHDYALLAIKRHAEGAKEMWSQLFQSVKKHDSVVVEPIKAFLNGDLKHFKEARRQLESSQKNYDHLTARYASQNKSKEASSLREDAFQLHEARKAYLKSSMDFSVVTPQLRVNVDKLIIKIFADQWKALGVFKESLTGTMNNFGGEMERIKGWAREMENSERAFKREVLEARKQIEDTAMAMIKPSRELVDYETSTVPFIGKTASGAPAPMPANTAATEKGDKQGWLYQKTVVGKPARTVWLRRWFFVKAGIFGWLVQGSKSGGVEESEKTGVLLCGVKPAFQEERRFCFEVKTKDASIILQSETQGDLLEWIATFDVAKRRALENPTSNTSTQLVTGLDPAFAFTAPLAPEFAASNEASGGEGLSAFDLEGGIAARASFDVTANRRVPSSAFEQGEHAPGTRERIAQKLDLHKRNATPTTQAPVKGIASLISASHHALPVGPGAPQTPKKDAPKRSFTLPNSAMHATSSLAPNTLANPPAPTNLSQTAVIVSGERGVALDTNADGAVVPSGMMANLWGSTNWGSINILGGDEKAAGSPPRSISISQPSSPVLKALDDSASIATTDATSRQLSIAKHRKTQSDAMSPSPPKALTLAEPDDFPASYPLALKAQQAQFRMLFPMVPSSEKVVLVFRSTCKPNEQQEFPGRVYVTAKAIYFYSHHLGLVLITSMQLTSIDEVTAAPGRDCDFLYLLLQVGPNSDTRRRITLRIFLDSLKLLQRRLSYLVHNASLEEPAALDVVVKKLLVIEQSKPKQRSSSMDSWEDLVYGDDAIVEDSRDDDLRQRNVRTALRIDGNIYGETAKTGREVMRFQIPRQPVIYAPQGMQQSHSREYNVSAKALFHATFGDKSAIFLMLLAQGASEQVAQGSWTKQTAGPEGRWSRRLTGTDAGTPWADEQTVDIWNDHLCYAVSDKKQPRGMPYAASLDITTRYVITHVAKSRCKLSVYQKLTWGKAPVTTYVRNVVEKHALNQLGTTATELSNMVMDQVLKLGNYNKTNKAIQVFGHIGQQAATPSLEGSALTAVADSGKFARQRPSLTRLLLSDAIVRLVGAVSMTLDFILSALKWAFNLTTAHTLLVALLTISAFLNSWFSGRDSLQWYHERTAARFMNRLSVRADHTVSRALYLRDVDELVSEPTTFAFGNATAHVLPVDSFHHTYATASQPQTQPDSCASTFSSLLVTSSSQYSLSHPPTPPHKPSSAFATRAAQRLHRTRASLAHYRHDLLVALRVVNRVEREAVAAEWASWVDGEVQRCEQAGLLGRRGQGAEQTGKDEVWRELGIDEYCGDCMGELRGLKG